MENREILWFLEQKCQPNSLSLSFLSFWTFMFQWLLHNYLSVLTITLCNVYHDEITLHLEKYKAFFLYKEQEEKWIFLFHPGHFLLSDMMTPSNFLLCVEKKGLILF